jgi:zinc transport system substrate-binding protein
VLNPLEGLTDEQLKNGDDYFSVMEKNLTVLKEALE